jgi:phosphoribosylglycinamide formyltransferase 1
MIKPLYAPKKEPMRLAAFMSGNGTNVRKIIERQLQLGPKSPFRVELIFTDNSESNAAKIAAEYKIPFFGNDIKEYYLERNANRKDMEVRRQYDVKTREELEKNSIDAVALCGYMSIITGEILGKYITLNVHPADLRKKGKDGKRLYAGLHGMPSIKAAIQNGDRELRSTVHLVNSGVDLGPILAVSGPVRVEITAQEKKDPALFESAAELNMENLKVNGDWIIYPKAIEMLAMGRFAFNEDGEIYLDGKKIPDGIELGA